MKVISYIIIKSFFIIHFYPLIIEAVQTKKIASRVQNVNSFYQAMCSAYEEDLLFIERQVNTYSFQQLKRVLGAQKIEKKISQCIAYSEEYYEDQAYEPFVHILKKFPPSSADLLAKLLITSITASIINRRNNQWGTKEVEWLKEELASLRTLYKDALLDSNLPLYRYRSGSL